MESEKKIYGLLGQLLDAVNYNNKLMESLVEILDEQRHRSQERSREMKEHLEELSSILPANMMDKIKKGQLELSPDQIQKATQVFSNPKLQKLVRQQFGGKENV